MNGHLANLNTSQHEKLWCHEMYYLKNLTKRLLPFRVIMFLLLNVIEMFCNNNSCFAIVSTRHLTNII